MVLQQILLTARYLEPLLVTLLPRLIALPKHLLKFLLFRPCPVVETVTVGDDLVGIGMVMTKTVRGGGDGDDGNNLINCNVPRRNGLLPNKVTVYKTLVYTYPFGIGPPYMDRARRAEQRP